jgi:hypothetical protein
MQTYIGPIKRLRVCTVKNMLVIPSNAVPGYFPNTLSLVGLAAGSRRRRRVIYILGILGLARKVLSPKRIFITYV